jgi:hypothetical protein
LLVLPASTSCLLTVPLRHLDPGCAQCRHSGRSATFQGAALGQNFAHRLGFLGEGSRSDRKTFAPLPRRTEVDARAAAWIVGADRWSEARWVDLEAQVAEDGKNEEGHNKAAAGSIRAVRSPARRRSVASNYMR